MVLSDRLFKVANAVRINGVTADIGCDHALTDIFLVKEGISKSAIAMDIGEGPLERAKEHVEAYGMEDKIQIRLSDGLEKLEPGEADTILISGMGAELICNILKNGKDVVAKTKELVLSPQSEIYKVRHLLHDLGFLIDYEDMVFDAGKYYVIIHAVQGDIMHPQKYAREYEYTYGKYLIDTKNEVLHKFFDSELKRIDNAISRLSDKTNDEPQKEQTTDNSTENSDETNHKSQADKYMRRQCRIKELKEESKLINKILYM